MSTDISTPSQVRAAGALVCLQALAALGFAVALLVRGLAENSAGNIAFAVFGAFLVIGVAISLPGIALLRGKRGGRNAAVFVQLLLLGATWYQFSPAEWIAADIAITVYCVAVLILLFLPNSRTWATNTNE